MESPQEPAPGLVKQGLKNFLSYRYFMGSWEPQNAQLVFLVACHENVTCEDSIQSSSESTSPELDWAHGEGRDLPSGSGGTIGVETSLLTWALRDEQSWHLRAWGRRKGVSGEGAVRVEAWKEGNMIGTGGKERKLARETRVHDGVSLEEGPER